MKRATYFSAAVVLVLGAFAIYLTLGPRDSRAGGSVPQLSDVKRKRLDLPLSGELTLATKEDINSASLVDADVRNAIFRCIPRHIKWQVSARRDTGEFVILWIGYSEITDGGIDLIYSKKSKRTVCSFLGGYRG